MDAVENEMHFLLSCPAYEADRAKLSTRLQQDGVNFPAMSDKEQLQTLLVSPDKHPYIVSFIRKAWCLRRECLEYLEDCE